jgi:hypothetical protein
MDRKKASMPGGLTRQEFEGLREDFQQILSEHPRARFMVVFLDEEGRQTEDSSKFKKYGLSVYEDEHLLYEEIGDIVDGMARKKGK